MDELRVELSIHKYLMGKLAKMKWVGHVALERMNEKIEAEPFWKMFSS